MECSTSSSLDVPRERPTVERGLTSVGSVLDGRYRVGKTLGQGGMGLVLAAHDLLLDRPVAIKLLDPARATRDLTKAFEKEACALAQVRHANVVLVYAFGVCPRSSYIVMEHVNGRDLASLIAEAAVRGGRVVLARAVEIIRQVGHGLQAVHARRLVHRDVKPSNIVIETNTGRPVLIDFGLARRRSRPGSRLSIVAGTPGYMAPEAAHDVSGTATTARTDQYALACTTFELLSGHPVFEHGDPLTVLRAHIVQTPPRLSSLAPTLAPLDAVLRRAMAKAPGDRYPSCAAFIEALDNVAGEILTPVSAVRRAAPKNRVRVILAHRDDDARQHVASAVKRVVDGAGDDAAIEFVASRAELFASFAREPADMVVVDDASVAGTIEGVVERLRRVPGGDDAEVLVLAGDGPQPARLEDLGARQLPKPLHMNALATVIGRMSTLLAQRRSGRFAALSPF